MSSKSDTVLIRRQESQLTPLHLTPIGLIVPNNNNNIDRVDCVTHLHSPAVLNDDVERFITSRPQIVFRRQ